MNCFVVMSFVHQEISNVNFLRCTYIDLNECETGQHGCNPNTSKCFNTPGSFTCHCISGFEDSVNSKNERICEGNLFHAELYIIIVMNGDGVV